MVSKVTAEALAPHEGGEAQTVLRKSRTTALKCVFDEVKRRLTVGGLVANSLTLRTVISTQCHQQLIIIKKNITTN